MYTYSVKLLFSEVTQTSMTVPWSEGGLEDFSDLHSAIDGGLTQKFSGELDYDSESGSDDPESASGNESDEEEVEPSPDDHGKVQR